MTKEIELSNQAILWLNEYRKLQEAKKNLEEKMEIVRSHIEEELGESETGTINGAPVIRYTWVEIRRFDQSKAKAFLTTEQVEECLTPSTSRRFVPVNPEELA